MKSQTSPIQYQEKHWDLKPQQKYLNKCCTDRLNALRLRGGGITLVYLLWLQVCIPHGMRLECFEFKYERRASVSLMQKDACLYFSFGLHVYCNDIANYR